MVTPAPVRPQDLLDAALRQDGTRPLLTFYDDHTDERVELSVATFANWVAKTVNLLRDDLGTEAGQRIRIRLPPHWQSAVWLSSCWALGATAVVGDRATPCDVAVIAADDPDPPTAAELVVLGLGPLGLPRPHDRTSAWSRERAVDYDREIHSHGDHFIAAPALVAPEQQTALEVNEARHSEAELLARTSAAAQAWQLQPGDRVLCASALDALPAILATLLVPLAAGVGAVLCRHLDAGRLSKRVAAERVVALLPEPGGALTVTGQPLPVSRDEELPPALPGLPDLGPR